METVARVVALEGDGSIAYVETRRRAACDGCHKAENGGCSVCSLMVAGDPHVRTKAHNAVGAAVGDRVEVTSPSGRMMWYAALVFLLPIVVGIAGYMVGERLSELPVWRYACAVGGFVLTLALVAVYSRVFISRRCDAEIVRVLPRDASESDGNEGTEE